MGKLEEIVSGWTNVLFTDPEVEKEALRRAKICAPCEFNKNNKCSACGCPLVAKTRSTNSKCPKDKW